MSNKCKPVCQLCDRLIISTAVTFADGALTINLPAGSYNDGQRYCIVVAQALPAETTITAPVVVTIGDGTVEYPIVTRCGVQVQAGGLRTRYRYPVVVATDATGGAFKLIANVCGMTTNRIAAIDGTDLVTTPPAGGD